MKWNSIDIAPPDEDVEVMDAQGRTCIATPAYFPFEVVKRKIVPCEPYQDGWLIPCGSDLLPLVGDVVAWRKTEQVKMPFPD